MIWSRLGAGRRLRLFAGATATAAVMVIAVPVALAAYTGAYAPTLAVTPHTLFVPGTLTCATGTSGSATLNWSGTGSTTTDPYGGFASDGYLIEVTTDSGTTWPSSSRQLRTATTSMETPPNLGLLGLGAPVSYRIRSTRSNWVSLPSNVVTVHVTVIAFVHLVVC